MPTDTTHLVTFGESAMPDCSAPPTGPTTSIDGGMLNISGSKAPGFTGSHVAPGSDSQSFVDSSTSLERSVASASNANSPASGRPQAKQLLAARRFSSY